MDAFSYLSVLLSIVLGLAVTQLRVRGTVREATPLDGLEESSGC